MNASPYPGQETLGSFTGAGKIPFGSVPCSEPITTQHWPHAHVLVGVNEYASTRIIL